MKKTTGTDFEEYVWRGVWRRRFPPSKGWDSEQQKLLAGGYQVDFVARRGSKRAVGDAKDKAQVTRDDVGKLIEDAGIYKATWLLLIVAADTEIPGAVREYAEDNGVKIVRTRWRA